MQVSLNKYTCAMCSCVCLWFKPLIEIFFCPGYSSYTNFAIRNDLNSVAIKKILEGSTDGEVEAIRKMRTLYQSCMDTTATESRGVEPLLHLISSTGMCVCVWCVGFVHVCLSARVILCLVHVCIVCACTRVFISTALHMRIQVQYMYVLCDAIQPF